MNKYDELADAIELICPFIEYDSDFECVKNIQSQAAAVLRGVGELVKAAMEAQDDLQCFKARVSSLGDGGIFTTGYDYLLRRLAQSEQKRHKLRSALEFYASDDSTAVEMGILEDVSLRPATAALKADEEE